MYDLVIKNGNIVDGTGTKSFLGDIAIKDNRIEKIGSVSEVSKREIDAEENLVTPGWVDIHTHYDGQSLWDPYLTPSSWHGCTTVVMGNCGVGFAPVAPKKEQWLIELMESVEDIPGSALAEGIDWEWDLLRVILRLGRKGYAAGSPNRRADRARAGATGTLLPPGLLATAGDL